MDQLWQKVRGEFVDVIEWDEDGTAEPGGEAETLVWRFPRQDNAIKVGAQLTVREGQWAVFVNEGRIADGFGPGRHRLETRNLPLLTTLLSLPYGFVSPFKADVFFVATRQFTDLRWGTRHPVILRDPELGPVRVRGFGTYALRVSDPVRLIREVSGASGQFTVEGISEQLRNLIVSRLADLLGESGLPVLELPARYGELGRQLQERLGPEFASYGLQMPTLLIENLSLPPEVEAALDRSSGIALTGDLQAFTAYQRGIALEKAAANPGGPAAAAAGLAMGFAMGTPPAVPPSPPPPPPFPVPPGEEGEEGPSQRPYHLVLRGESQGPYRLAELRSLRREGRLQADTLVWHPTLEGWRAAGGIAELAPLFEAPPPPPPPPPGAPAPPPPAP
jgi:membrane protease subunit (stomatin/prohibitin family)